MMYTVTKTCLLFPQDELWPYVKSYIKSVHPCTGLIARFAQQNVLLLRTTDIRVGTEKKHRGNKAEAVERLEQSAKERCILKGFLGKSMKADNKLKEQINDILSEWNPLDVPAFIASEEYMNYVDSIINIGRNINALRRYFISLIIDRLGLEYDPSNLEQINSIENVIEKVMNTLLKSGNV